MARLRRAAAADGAASKSGPGGLPRPRPRTDPSHEQRTPDQTLAEDLARDRDLDDVAAEVVRCRACPRLVAWREQAALEPPARYAGWTYWARPLPGFGDAAARIVIVGLAPAANGGNRTGRIFTGDRSGDALFAALHRVGLANQPTSVRPGDGLRIRRTYVLAAVRCAPPANRPLPEERDHCLPYLVRELRLLPEARVIVALGAFAWDAALRAVARSGHRVRPRPSFGHGAEARIGPYLLVGCYHPSQRNTFTGRLTAASLEALLARARDAAAIEPWAGLRTDTDDEGPVLAGGQARTLSA